MVLPLRLRYQTVEFGSTDIHICSLRDKQEFNDAEGIAEELGISSAQWPLFGVVWPSSLVLAHYMSEFDFGVKRILEVGCGMALSSLLLNKKKADITATDYHPDAEHFLHRNTALNNDSQIDFERVNWSDDTDSLGLFDVIIGSDLLYEDEHIELLGDFIVSHASPLCEVIIVDPGRGRKNKLSTQLTNAGFTGTHSKPLHTNYLDVPFKGYILSFIRG